MLVEDDKSLREIYSIRLAAEGYSIALAGDGEEALSVVVQEKPDLIIADVMMPKISGFDMLDILRSQPETKNIKVIMMTALSSDDQRQRSEALGAAKHLVKSQVGIEDVINAVHEVLGDAPNANAQSNIDTAKAVSDLENKPATPVASTNSTVVEPASQDAPSAPEAPQGPIATPQNGDQSANFNQAPTTVPAAQVQFAQPVVGAINNGMPAPQLVTLQTVPVMQTVPGMQQEAAQQVNGLQQNIVPLPVPQVNLPQPNAIQSALAQNAVRLQMSGVNPTAEQVMQQANLQAIQSMYSQMTAQNSTLKPADRVLPNAQVAAIAAMQAAQQQSGTAPLPSPASPTPAQERPEEKKEKGASERVIQPLHDPFAEQQRGEMQKRMAAILGEDTEDTGPTTINTKTARKEKIEMKIPTAEQAAAAVPVDAAQVVQQAMPQTTADASQNVQQAVAQTPVQQAAPQTAPVTQTQPSPVEAALKAQAEKAAQAPAAQGEQKPDPTDLSKITVDTEIPSIDEIEDPGVDVTIKAAVPGYLSDLEDELSTDLADGMANDPNSMAARMSAELVGDEVTQVAKEKAEAELAARKAEAEELLKNPARQVKQTTMSPNIQSAAAEEPAEEATQQAPAAPQATPAPQAPAAPVSQQPAAPQTAQSAPAPQPQQPATQPQAAPTPAQAAPQIIQTMGPQEMGALS